MDRPPSVWPQTKGVHTSMRNLFIGLLVVAAIVIGGGFVANEAYQAGLYTAVTTAAAMPPPARSSRRSPRGLWLPVRLWLRIRPGWGHGFSIFGFLGTLLFIFIIFGLLRAAFGRGRGWAAVAGAAAMASGARAVRSMGQRRARPAQPLPPDLRGLASGVARRIELDRRVRLDRLDRLGGSTGSTPPTHRRTGLELSHPRGPRALPDPREGASVSLGCRDEHDPGRR